MNCPHDDKRLVVQDSDGGVGFTCDGCGGKWLPRQYLESMKYRLGQDPISELRRKLAAATRTTTALACPTGCGSLNAAVLGEIELDWCPCCGGIWFDRQELNKALALCSPQPQVSSSWDSVDLFGALLEWLVH